MIDTLQSRRRSRLRDCYMFFKVKSAATENLHPVIFGLFRMPEGVTVHATRPHSHWKAGSSLLLRFVKTVHSITFGISLKPDKMKRNIPEGTLLRDYYINCFECIDSDYRYNINSQSVIKCLLYVSTKRRVHTMTQLL